jgi:pilus assembly protein Flp/PilA
MGVFQMVESMMKFWKDESGATAVEYGLIAALIAVAVIVGATALGSATGNTMSDVASEVGKAGN